MSPRPRREGGPRRHDRRTEGGFTLVELMVALVVSALLVGMILSIFTRMSAAYRAQQNIAELQQTLAAAQEMIQRDLRQAGYQVPDGFRWASAAPTTTIQPLQVINNADGFGPDQLRIYHADATAQARVPPGVNGNTAAPFTSVGVDDVDLFAAGDLAVLVVAPRPADNAERLPNGARWYHYHACVVRITGVGADALTLDTAAPWGTASNDHCDAARSRLGGADDTSGMIYRFRARAYRIDPARRALAVLQLSPTGGLIDNDWQDLGVGFTDLQIATRWNDHFADEGGAAAPSRNDTDDPDDDPVLDWYSSERQESLSAPIMVDADLNLYHRPIAAEARVSLVVRTIKKVDAIPTAATPVLIDAARPDNNDLGDRPAVQLEAVADAARPAELRGDAVYRHATIGSDLRNLAVGQ